MDAGFGDVDISRLTNKILAEFLLHRLGKFYPATVVT